MPNFNTSDGLSLHYTDQGTGPAILCLSGLTRNGSDFSYVTPHLPGLRLIKLDYRGRGKSDWAADHTTYNVPREVQDTLELMDHLGLGQAAILGTSRGGLIALGLAAAARHRLTGVAFVDIGPVVDMKGIEAILGYLGRNPTWKTWAEAATQRPAVMAGFANVPPERWRQEVEKMYHQTPDGLIINYDPRLRDAVLEAGTQELPDLWPLYDLLAGLPVAVIRGVNSDLLTAATMDEMAKRVPGTITATVPDRGHVPFLDEPEAIKALHAWTDQL